MLMGLNKEEPEGRARISAFYEGLRALGWIENRNVQIDVRGPAAAPTALAIRQILRGSRT